MCVHPQWELTYIALVWLRYRTLLRMWEGYADMGLMGRGVCERSPSPSFIIVHESYSVLYLQDVFEPEVVALATVRTRS